MADVKELERRGRAVQRILRRAGAEQIGPPLIDRLDVRAEIDFVLDDLDAWVAFGPTGRMQFTVCLDDGAEISAQDWTGLASVYRDHAPGGYSESLAKWLERA